MSDEHDYSIGFSQRAAAARSMRRRWTPQTANGSTSAVATRPASWGL